LFVKYIGKAFAMLRVMDLKKNYGARESVKGISFDAQVHEVVGLLGPNGAGKSTIMRMLAGYLAPTAGDIQLGGMRMAERPQDVKRLIGYLPEIPPLYPYLTVLEHLQFVCSLRDIRPKDTRNECDRVCAMLNISHVSERAIGHLSKGYRQRVGFAAALIGDPKLLILDEPTVGLDPQQVIEIRGLIQTLSENMTVLISSHILSEISGICSRLLFLFDGKLLADGDINTITDSYQKNPVTTVSVRGEHEVTMQTMLVCAQEQNIAILETHSENEHTHFTLDAPKETPVQEIVFRAFAPKYPRLVLTQLHTRIPSLEDIFLEITTNTARPGEGMDA
jgi:ABC-2 type transport system ATP-binding protein